MSIYHLVSGVSPKMIRAAARILFTLHLQMFCKLHVRAFMTKEGVLSSRCIKHRRAHQKGSSSALQSVTDAQEGNISGLLTGFLHEDALCRRTRRRDRIVTVVVQTILSEPGVWIIFSFTAFFFLKKSKNLQYSLSLNCKIGRWSQGADSLNYECFIVTRAD